MVPQNQLNSINNTFGGFFTGVILLRKITCEQAYSYVKWADWMKRDEMVGN